MTNLIINITHETFPYRFIHYGESVKAQEYIR